METTPMCDHIEMDGKKSVKMVCRLKKEMKLSIIVGNKVHNLPREKFTSERKVKVFAKNICT